MISRRGILGFLAGMLPSSALANGSTLESRTASKEPRHYGDEPYCPERFFSRSAFNEWARNKLFFDGMSEPFQFAIHADTSSSKHDFGLAWIDTVYMSRSSASSTKADGRSLDVTLLRMCTGDDEFEVLSRYMSIAIHDGLTFWDVISDRPFFRYHEFDNGDDEFREPTTYYYQCDFDGPHYMFNRDGTTRFVPSGMSPSAAKYASIIHQKNESLRRTKADLAANFVSRHPDRMDFKHPKVNVPIASGEA